MALSEGAIAAIISGVTGQAFTLQCNGALEYAGHRRVAACRDCGQRRARCAWARCHLPLLCHSPCY